MANDSDGQLASDLSRLVPPGMAPATTGERRCYTCSWWHRDRLDWAIGECGTHRRHWTADNMHKGPSIRLLVSTPRHWLCPSYEESAKKRKEDEENAAAGRLGTTGSGEAR